MFDKILVAVDGSQNAQRGLEVSVDLAKKYGASITIIHTVERPVYAYSDYVMVPQQAEIVTYLEKEGEKLLLKGREEVEKEGIKVSTLLVTGEPSEEIIKASESHDLIVMGSRGLGRVKALLLGSVSSKVSHYARKPVLIIRPA